MPKQIFLAALALVPMTVVQSAVGDDVRYFEKDGLTYKETRRTVDRPVYETRYEDREQTVYREQYQTHVQESARTVHTPVTEYRWTTVMRGRWNPFVQPYFTQVLKPYRCWQAQQHVVRTPVHQRQLVPEKRTVRVPVTSQRMAKEEVITRVVVSGTPATGTAIVHGSPTIAGSVGGVARLDNDPPRQSTTWRPSTPSVLR